MFSVSNVSFQGRRVDVSPTLKVKDATAAQIAQTINSAYNVAGKKLGVPELKPLRPVSGRSIMELNPDCFDKTHKLNDYGMAGFNHVNKDLGVSVDSPIGHYSKAIKDYITKYYGLSMDDNVCRRFDYLV